MTTLLPWIPASNISSVANVLLLPTFSPPGQESSRLPWHNESNVTLPPSIMHPHESDNTNIRHDGTDLPFTTGKIIFSVFMFILNIFMLFGNTVSIVTITKTKFLRQRPYYWLVLNLGIVDLCNSLTVVPLNTLWELYGTWPFGSVLCKIMICADLSFSAIASYSTVLVSIDKFLYITKPFLYHSISAPCIVITAIVTVWSVWIAFSAASVFGDFARNKDLNETIYEDLDICNFVMTDVFAIISALFTFFIPFFILLFTSIKILCVARKHICRIAANNSVRSPSSRTIAAETSNNVNTLTVPRASIWNTSSSANFPSRERADSQARQVKRTIPRSTCRAFGTVMIVIAFFIIMFAPYWFAAVVDVACSCIEPWVYEDYLSVFYYMHSLVNPYIYMFTDRRYKKALKLLIHKYWKRKNTRIKNGSFSSELLN